MSFRRGRSPRFLGRRNFIVALLAGILASLAALALASGIMLISGAGTEYAGLFSHICFSAGVYAGAYVYGRLSLRNGLRRGLMIGAALYILCFIGALIGGQVGGDTIVIRAVLAASIGGMGGVMGVNG